MLIATRTMTPELYTLSGSLLPPAIPRVAFSGVEADEYFYRLMELDAEWVINIDEDAFVWDFSRIAALIERMKAEGYVAAGIPDGGVINHRTHNPLAHNAFFNIVHVGKLRPLFDERTARASAFDDSLIPYAPEALLQPGRFTFDEFESYYRFFFWILKSGQKILSLGARPWAQDPTSTLPLDDRGEPFLVHSWYSRAFDEQRERILNAFEYARVRKALEGPLTVRDPSVKASICIVERDRPHFLEEALRSALGQDVDVDFEVLVVDDASSSPEVAQCLERFSSEKLRVHFKKTQEGEGRGRTTALQEMRGEFALWLDDDDVLTREALAAHLATLASHPDADVLYGHLVRTDAKLNPLEDMRYRSLPPEHVLPTLLFYSPFSNPGSMVRRSLFERVGGYDGSFRVGTDYDFWARAALEGAKFQLTDRFVCLYRGHEGNAALGKSGEEHQRNNARVVDKLLGAAPLRRLFPYYDWTPERSRSSLCKAHAALALLYVKYDALERARLLLTESKRFGLCATAVYVEGRIAAREGRFDEALQAHEAFLRRMDRDLHVVAEAIGVGSPDFGM